MPAITPKYFQRDMPPVSTPDQAPPPTPPIRKHKFKTPKLRIHIEDLGHEGSSIFLSNIKGNEDIEAQVQNVLNLLYTEDCERPPTRSVTIILRQMGGVAYTTGTDLDHDHKELHFNLSYILNTKSPKRQELLGVICHELVHCFQWAANGTCPGGLIEGMADWVRLRAGLGAVHWKQEAGGKWDGGYQHTGFFLEYLEQRFGEGTVRKINGCLRGQDWDEKRVFGDCCGGKKIDELWNDYQDDLKKKKKSSESEDDEPANPVPTHAAQR